MVSYVAPIGWFIADKRPSIRLTPIFNSFPMEPRRNPPRSAKRAKFDKSELLDEYWEPDLKNPASHVDRRLQALNLEAYPVNVFGRVDDLIMFSAFASKGKK